MNELERIIDELQTIVGLLEQLRVLKEYELGVRIEHSEHGPYVPVNNAEE
jgi:hypothetical protein